MAKDKKKLKKKDKVKVKDKAKAKAKALKAQAQKEVKAKAKKAQEAAAAKAKALKAGVGKKTAEATKAVEKKTAEVSKAVEEKTAEATKVVEGKAAEASKMVEKIKRDAEPIIAQGMHTLGMDPLKITTPDDEGLTKLSSFFKIFADPTRLRILYALAEGPKCVADIAAAAGVTQGATSHQLRSMKQEKLVDFERDGKQVIYSLADDRVQTLLAQGYSYINE